MGRVTKIEEGKRNKGRVNVYVDEDFAFAIDGELAYKMGLKKNLEIDEEKIKEAVLKDGFSKCKERAIKIVERSYKTEKELRTKLKSYEFLDQQIDYAINFLIEYKFLDDAKYTRMYIKDKLFNQGSNKIKFTLERKGINRELIEEILSEFDKSEEVERGIYLCEKKYNILKGKESDKYKLKDKLFRYLVGRGYEFSSAKEIINKVLSNDEY
ncbi:MAG: recombination regulator RecX [Clostridium sp.]|uniref:recombination regulator RecX n=1 Tax=Clostridium sp. TaxID=1506 RepID=UPI003EE4FD5D